jgi:hypothetical protein
MAHQEQLLEKERKQIDFERLEICRDRQALELERAATFQQQLKSRDTDLKIAWAQLGATPATRPSENTSYPLDSRANYNDPKHGLQQPAFRLPERLHHDMCPIQARRDCHP